MARGAPGDAGRVSYRELGLFWTVTVFALGAGAAVLQTLGPPPNFLPPAVPATPAIRAAVAQQKRVAIAAADPALLEPAPDFPGRNLPQIGAGNRAPLAVYAAPFDAADKHPRVAIVVAGAGLDQEQTLHLLEDLPGAVTVAFSAYMPEPLEDGLASQARRTGHECLQSVPMEPVNYPLSEEGARELLTGADAEQNRLNLEWALSRMPACAGATGASDGMLGERFAQTSPHYADVLNEATKRGLLYLDPRTGSPSLATAGGPNVRIVDMVVDQSPNGDGPAPAEVIDQRLAALEHIAQVRGTAIGLAGPPKPVLLDRLAVWVHGLAARGVTLAPLSAMPGLPPLAAPEGAEEAPPKDDGKPDAKDEAPK